MQVNPKSVKSHFEKSMDKYDENATVQKFLAEILAAETTKLSNSYGKILELGCGTGLLTKEIVKKIHFEICKGQNIYPLGDFRKCGVGITGTSWRPKLPSECDYEAELNELFNISSEIDRCISIFCWIQRSQMFLDGNKRVANLIANKEMIRNGQGVIAVPVEKIGDYMVRLIKYYETNDMTELKKWIYDNCIDGIN